MKKPKVLATGVAKIRHDISPDYIFKWTKETLALPCGTFIKFKIVRAEEPKGKGKR